MSKIVELLQELLGSVGNPLGEALTFPLVICF